MLKKINETIEFLHSRITEKPEVGIILGTGLGGLIHEIDIHHSIPYEKFKEVINI